MGTLLRARARRALGADVDPTQPLRVPETLEGLVRARLDKLPPATQDAAARSGRGPSLRRAVREPGRRRAVLDRALAARVIEQTDGTIRFTHPLLASVVYHGVSAVERRRAHGRLALVVADPLDRARHLALSTESPDARSPVRSRMPRPWPAPAGTDRRGRARRARAQADGAGRPQRPASSSAHGGARPAQRGRVDARAKDTHRSPRGDTSGFLARRSSCAPCRAGERTSFRPTARGSPARGSFAPSASVSHPLSARVGELQARVRPCT